MNKITIVRHAAVAALATCLCGAAAAQTTPPETAKLQQREIARGEPSRWMKADPSTQAQIATKRKEIGAALSEAMTACKRMPAADRGGCVKEARQTYNSDMANVRQLVAASNQMGGTYETTGPSD